MSRHVSYRGVTIDMETFRRENEKVVAAGNMGVNARGDKLNRGQVTKTADQIARENHRIQSAVVNTGLKGKQPVAPAPVIEAPKKPKVDKTEVKAPAKATKEIELESGDIIIEDDE